MKNRFYGMTEEKAGELIAKAKKMRAPSARGSQSIVFLIKDFAVKTPRNGFLNDMGMWIPKMQMNGRVIKLLPELKSRGVHVYPILAIKDGYTIEPRANGTELYDYRHIKKSRYVMRRTKTLADAPQTHFDGFVSDYRDIIDSRIYVDSNSHMNFFYDKQGGFSFIDLNRMLEGQNYEYYKEKLASECLLPVHKSFCKHWGNHYGFPTLNKQNFHELQEANTEIFQKCARALISNKISTEEKLKNLNPRVNSITFRDYQKCNGQKIISGADLDFY